MKSSIRWMLLAALVQTAAGCGLGIQSGMMTNQEIDTYGTKELAAPPPKVFQAVVGALKGQGFAIAVENEAKGLIKTNRRLIRSAAMGGAGYAQAIDYTRSYSARIWTLPNGATRVSLEPRVFAGEQDLSGGKVWVLDGEQGERTLWQRLFKDIEELL